MPPEIGRKTVAGFASAKKESIAADSVKSGMMCYGCMYVEVPSGRK